MDPSSSNRTAQIKGGENHSLSFISSHDTVPEPPIHLARLLLELGLATPPPFHFFSFTKGETILLHLTTCIIFFVRFCTISRFGHGTTVRSVQTLFTRRTAADRHTRIVCSQDSNCDTKFFDFIVVGSGVAGLRYALEVSKYGSVAIITKAEPQASNTNYAQGGVSAVLCPSDSVENMQDTTIAGAYLCDEETVKVTDYELIPGGRNIRVIEETKHEYVDLVAEHILTTTIRPQINSFLEGFNELVPKELILIFNDKELELLLIDDLQANTEYTGYSAASTVIQWFWEVVKSFNKEDMARLLQFVTRTSKVPLEGFKALQGISGPQQFQIHKTYGAPERLPSTHTCFNQLDLPEYSSREQLEERLLLAIHEATEGFGFG
ncbi:hypothetical protein ZIOFF_050633 [Zingiber officinale]|uniref:HECT-type E3 ubiquitin transferase n=2 Tax=Zingiber officinale TaxID=94328 RepID=A0A8J5KQI7_ZINOF|nr:hypothetical protein ZIOFF_050633 [Zingiber officinale]